MKKLAISVTTNIEPETGFIAGFPQSPGGAIARPETMAIPRRVPKTMSLKTEGGISTAIAEGASQMVSDLERKFGSAFIRGFLYELGKEGSPKALRQIKARLSAVKPQLTYQRPMPHEELRRLSSP